MSNVEYLILGCLIGFFAGYVTNWMRTFEVLLYAIKEEVDEVDAIVKKQNDDIPGDERQMPESEKKPTLWQHRINWKNLVLFFVVLLVAYSAINSQLAANTSRHQSHTSRQQSQKLANTVSALTDTQEQLTRVVACANNVLDDTVVALNERTTYTSSQADANFKLQTDQAAFFQILIGPPPADAATASKATHNYQQSLATYLGISRKAATKVIENPYPAKHALSTCVVNAKKQTKEK